MMRVRSSFMALAAMVSLLPLLTFAAAARADWPDRPVKWVVPFGPGGANDLIARAAAEAVSKQIRQPISCRSA